MIFLKNYEKYETPREKVSTFLKEAEASFLAESSKQTLLLFAEWLDEEAHGQSKLRSCECGGSAETSKFGKGFITHCLKCPRQTDYQYTEKAAILAWNRREFHD